MNPTPSRPSILSGMFAACLMLAGCGGGRGGGTSFVPPPGTGPLMYVTDSGNAILEFPQTANGNVSPVASISGTNTQLVSATAIARDSSGRIYVANQNQNQILGFSSSVTGNASPLFQISGGNTQLHVPAALLFDSQGRLWVANAFSDSLSVYASPASTNGNVAPAFTISGSNTALSEPDGIGFDGSGNLYVSNFQSNAITVYSAASVASASSNGNVGPIRTIAGPATGLNSPSSLYATSSGVVYVPNVGGNSVTVYGAGANGNATPAATISGSATGLAAPEGLVLDSSGNIYVTIFNRPGFPGAILVFAPGSNGNASPSQIVAGSNTGLFGAIGISF